jgi:hypothetical protein
MKLHYEFEDIEDFYREALIVEETGNKSMFNRIRTEDDPYFRGLNLKDIYESKYSYSAGIDKIPELDSEISVGGSKFTFKWDELDGDEMEMERAYEGMPFLKKRTRKVGSGTGKFVEVRVSINELAYVEQEGMLNKAFTAASIVNALSAKGYSVCLKVVGASRSPGAFKGKNIDILSYSITVKRHEDPLNIGLILNCISPWFFRYWVFLFECAKVNTYSGLGQTVRVETPKKANILVINSGECLDKESSKSYIKDNLKLFGIDDQEDEEIADRFKLSGVSLDMAA